MFNNIIISIVDLLSRILEFISAHLAGNEAFNVRSHKSRVGSGLRFVSEANVNLTKATVYNWFIGIDYIGNVINVNVWKAFSVIKNKSSFQVLLSFCGIFLVVSRFSSTRQFLLKKR